MNRYDALQRRKSTRRYASEPVSKPLLDELRAEIESIQLLEPAAGLHIDLVEQGESIHRVSRGLVGDLGKNKAPHYLVLSGPPEKYMRVNAGFAGEHLVLSMTARGLASCWLGGHVKPSEMHAVVDTQAGHELAAMIGFGLPARHDDHLRPVDKRLSRKPLEQLMVDGTVDPGWRPILEAARRAPSAINGQPWRFLCDGPRLHCYITGHGSFIARKFLGQITFVDAGIALCHIAEAAVHQAKLISFEQRTDASHAGLDYIASVAVAGA